MYLHLGKDFVVKKKNIIGIFDMDTSTVAKSTRNFLNIAEKKGRVVNVSYELPKSFIVCNEDGKITVYISQISPSTLEKRNEGVLEIVK
jgi:peroxiredoxin